MSYIQPEKLTETEEEFNEALEAGEYLTLIQVAASLGIARQNCHKAVKAGALRAFMYGGKYHTTQEWVDAWRSGVRGGK